MKKNPSCGPLGQEALRKIMNEKADASVLSALSENDRLQIDWSGGLMELSDMEAACLNENKQQAELWLELLSDLPWAASHASDALLRGLSGGWLLDDGIGLIGKLAGLCGGQVRNAAGDDALLCLFRNRDSESSARPLWPACRELMRAGVPLDSRNLIGESALSRIHRRIEEDSLGWGNAANKDDLLRCAHALMDSGAPPSLLREEPPLPVFVRDADLRAMAMAFEELAEIRKEGSAGGKKNQGGRL